MRHKVSGNKLGRNSSWRKATIRDIAKATLLHQRIRTTKARAKQARKLVDRLITLGKKNTLPAKRRAFSILCNHQLVSILFSKISTRFKDRMGGYTRIIPLSVGRRGDNASLVYLELTEHDLFLDKKIAKEGSLKPKLQERKTKKEQIPEKENEKKAKESKEDQSGKDKEVLAEKDDVIEKEKSSKKMMGGIKKIFKKAPRKK